MAVKRKMAVKGADETLDNIDCPRGWVSRSFHCEDLRRLGASQHIRPHSERIQSFRTWRQGIQLPAPGRSDPRNERTVHILSI
jgi:hypothetical protein